MSLVYACICPRSVGESARIADAVEVVAEELASHRPETVVAIAASGAMPRPAIGVVTGAELELDGGARACDVALAERTVREARAAALPVAALRRWEGALEVACALPAGARIVAIAASALEPRFHFEFGRALGRSLDDDQRRAVLVCGVELSRGSGSPAARIFDEHYRRAIETWDVKWLVGVDADVRRRAHEGAVAQTAVLMGALGAYRIQPRVLAYQLSEDGGRLVAAIDVAGPRRRRRVPASARATSGRGPWHAGR